MLFDFATQKWAEIAKITCGFPNWSKNSDYVYFLHEENDPAVIRQVIPDSFGTPVTGKPYLIRLGKGCRPAENNRKQSGLRLPPSTKGRNVG
jgi:hypothetical protein